MSSFVNIIMELKKCCNHAQLVRPPEEETTDRLAVSYQLLYDKKKNLYDFKILIVRHVEYTPRKFCLHALKIDFVPVLNIFITINCQLRDELEGNLTNQDDGKMSENKTGMTSS